MLRASACLLYLCVLGCSFERRPEAQEDEVTVDVGADEDVGAPVPPENGARAAADVVHLFRESIAMGDLSLALGLLHGEAELVDGLIGEGNEELTRGELLLEVRRRVADHVHLEAVETDVALQGEASALVTSLLVMREVTPEGPGEVVGRLYESALLLPSDEGWRIRHLHRSFLSPHDGSF